MKEKWKITEANIKSEITAVAQLFDMCNSFKLDLDNNEQKKRETENNNNNNILMRDYLPKEQKEPVEKSESSKIIVKDNREVKGFNNDDKKWDRFGGKAPFQYNQNKDEDNTPIDNKIKNYQNDNPIVYKKPISSSADRKEKDPLVWDPPEEKINKQKKNNVVPTKKNVVVSKKPEVKSQQVDVDKKKNFEKPKKATEDKKANKEKDLSNKSSFLLNSYPDGVGPDSELIEMLEREVVDANPNVKFDDIAELDNAKNTLKEAVLLPLLMPDYFKVIFIFIFTGIKKTLEGGFIIWASRNW